MLSINHSPFVFMLSQVSWSKLEVIIDNPKHVVVSTSSKITIETPPVVVTAISLKTIIKEKQNVNEIIAASIICCKKAKVCYLNLF